MNSIRSEYLSGFKFRFQIYSICGVEFEIQILTGGVQNLEQQNVERPIFRNFKIANIKTTKDELFDSFIFELIFGFLINYLNI